MEMTITAKVQIVVSETDKVLLDKTMSVYRDAYNYVSSYIWETHDLSQVSLNKALYYKLRGMFGLKSQMAQSVLKTVIARYKAIIENQKEWIKPAFKKPQYDLVWNRDYSLNGNAFSVNTLDGRVKLPYFSKGMEEYFNSSVYRFGTAVLVNKHGKYYLHIPVSFEVEECRAAEIRNVTGVDRGINFLAVAYNSSGKTTFISGRDIKNKRAHYKELRRSLQKRGTSSARRRLKAIGQRENRWMQDVDHCASKALAEQNPKHTLFALEDLKGIRGATEKVRIRNRYVMVSWPYYDLEQKLTYKAMRRGSMVVKFDPRHTSQHCPKCGHTEKGNRDKGNHLFACKKCGYRSNDDRIAAMNLHSMGMEWVHSALVPGADAGE